jgi:hypothetical protein
VAAALGAAPGSAAGTPAAAGTPSADALRAEVHHQQRLEQLQARARAPQER